MDSAASSSSEEEDAQLIAARALVGTTLRGKYRLDRVLGAGGMGAVFASTHRNQAELAIKILHPELAASADVKARFLREGYAANSVKHPGVVLVLDDDVAESGAPFLVMELLAGDGVEALWEAHDFHLEPRVALAIADQLLDVLAAAHERGIVHRDIKPANLFVLHDGTVKVLDFGIARVRDSVVRSAAQTGGALLLGTPAFMAPEQARAAGKEIDGQSDLWGVGATIFALVSGSYVHEGDSALSLLMQVANKPARSLKAVAPNVPRPIAAFVDRALAFEKVDRWSDARAMQAALRAAYAEVFGRSVSRDVLASAATAISPTMPPASVPAQAPVHVRLAATTTGRPVTQAPTASDRRPDRAIALGAIAVVALAALVTFRQHFVERPTQPALALQTAGDTAPPVTMSAPPPPPPTESAIPAPTPRAAPPVRAKSTPVPTANSAPLRACEPPFFFDAQNRKVFKPECL